MRLVNDILVHAQVNFKKEIPMNYEAVDLKKLIYEVVSNFETQVQMRQIELSVDFDPDIQSNFHTDPLRLT